MSDILRDFDKKNEFPKVKLNLPKFDFSHLTEAVRNMNSAFDNIVKDIREQKDNAMAMEFTKCIGELLRKNGVIPKITEYTREHVKEHSIEQLYGVSIDELDFSAHDKVFEDKIAKLEKKNKDLQSCFTQREQDSTDMIMKLKQEKSDKNEKIAELACENESLKQRIAELESKETEKPTKINLNDRIKVKLTPLGAEIYYHQYDEVNKKIKENYGTELEPMMPRIDKDGYTEFQLHHFISLYGEHIGICKPNVINPLDIVLVDSHQTHPKAEIGT